MFIILFLFLYFLILAIHVLCIYKKKTDLSQNLKNCFEKCHFRDLFSEVP